MIKPVTYRELLSDPAWDGLMQEYAAECSLPELGTVDPQKELYRAMENSGGLKCFGVYAGDTLIGFISLLIYVLPHYGKKIATTESIFLAKKHRNSQVGMEMIRTVEGCAGLAGCKAVMYTAPVGSRFSSLLTATYRHSNNVFVRAL